MSDDVALPLEFTEAAANKVKTLIADEDNPDLKLRVYITGGGCSGFQYGFTFDDQVNDGDMTIEKQGVALVVDPMSLRVWFFVQHLSLNADCRPGKRSATGLINDAYLEFSSSANVGSFRCQRIAAKRITSVTTIPSIAAFSSGRANV